MSQAPLSTPPGSLLAALDGWETRDSDGLEPCSVERGTLAAGTLEVAARGLTYKQADALEAALYAAHSALAALESVDE